MLEVTFDTKDGSPLQVLCLGAHSDDIEIGCGGTILRLVREHLNLVIHWVVFASSGQRGTEALASAERFLEPLRNKRVVLRDFRDGFLPYSGRDLKECFEQLKQEVNPDIIFTHYRQDLHQDHRCVNELTWNTFRNHLILEYEIPKYDGDLGSPNLFVNLDEPTCRTKARLVLESFASQRDKHWFTEDTLLALPRLRGVESRSPGRYAEAFYCRKLSLRLSRSGA